MIPFSVILLNGNNDFGLISHWLNSHLCALWSRLGRMSMYIFLLHHTFTAQWKENTSPSTPDNTGTSNASNRSPKTGDENNPLLWLTVMIIALLSMIALLTGSARKRKGKNSGA